MIKLHDAITLAEAQRAADIIDCDLLCLPTGDFEITPRQMRKPAHSTSNVVKMVPSKLQFIGAKPE